MALQDLVTTVRAALMAKTKGFRVFFASGLNTTDTRTYWANLTPEERFQLLQLYNSSFNPPTPAKDVTETDDENLVAVFNAIFESASNVSSIANAYHGAPDIIAIFHSGPIQEDEIQVSLVDKERTANVKLTRDDVKSEVSQISRRSNWPKNRKDGLYGQSSRNSYSPVEYLTVLVIPEHGTETHQILTRNKPILANYSYIVSATGEIKRQKYGDPNKFVDNDGFNHKESCYY